ncbi:septum formation family protein [Nocardioides insulae]|uniref:septum formation family protein n=1 Tax=Nocardioides insulae TaxID=394734 RepID=UPI001FDFE732|nr:septum formation family protein [Nocardioides insulae]
MPGTRALASVATALLAATLLTACGSSEVPEGADPDLVDAAEVPEAGVCRNLEGQALTAATDATPHVECDEPHNSETYAAGTLPEQFHDLSVASPDLDQWAYQTCTRELRRHLGADESTVMRSVFSWVWYRPSERAWKDGARWYRCDAVAGGPQTSALMDLPTVTGQLLAKKGEDRWMACAQGDSFDAAKAIPCSQDHDWRAVTTIKLGEPDAPYPGDNQAQVTTRDFCSDSVDAWLSYPGDFDFGYTWFGESEWEAGNRRSICWAQTEK